MTEKPIASLVITHAAELLTCVPTADDLAGRILDGSVAVAGDKILAAGPASLVSSRVDTSSASIINARGHIVAPGFVDCHTHVIFGGSRIQEYTARMTHTNDEIDALGIPTGILASVAMTRTASLDELTQSAVARLTRMLAHGTTTVESKSGYGLNLDDECKMLKVNRRLNDLVPIDVVSTFLGAHAVPPEHSHEKYVDLVIHEMIPAVTEKGLAEFCDVYCDNGYFSIADTRRILESAHRAGLALKIHADQYSAIGGSELAAELGVTSADHLNFTSPAAMKALADAGVVGVVMPAIDFAVQHPQPFDAHAMRAQGMTLALATDLCPAGWTESMQLVMQLACRLHRFSPLEALFAATVGGARALGLNDRGALAPGQLADLQIWNLPTSEDVIYRLGHNAVVSVIKRGQVVFQRQEGLYGHS